MRTFIALVLVTIVLGLFGAAALGVARLEGHMANAQQQLATLQYDAAKDSLAEATKYADHSRWVPFLGRDERQEIRARNAALQYWKKDYDALVPAQAEPVAAVGDDNVELQLVVANAAYRMNQGKTKNNTWHTDAAYNYEYIVRLRDELAKGKQPPQPPKDQSEQSDNGESGAPSPATSSKGIQIYIPLEQGEKNPSGGEAGKAAPKERKG